MADEGVINDWHFIWNTKLRCRLDSTCELGNLILSRYKEDIPPEIFYDIFYLLNESNIVGQLLIQLKGIASMKNGRNFRLSTCLGSDSDAKKNIENSCKSIIKLYYWVNNEYKYLFNTSNLSVDNIKNISFNEILTKKLNK